MVRLSMTCWRPSSARQLFDVGQERKVPVLPLIIEAIPHDPLVRDLETDEIGLEVDLASLGFVEKGADLEGAGLIELDLLAQIGQGHPRIEDILHDEQVGPLDSERGREAQRGREDDLGQLVRAARGDALDETDVHRQTNLPRQIGQENERSLENTEDRKLLAGVFPGDLPAERADALADLGFRTEDFARSLHREAFSRTRIRLVTSVTLKRSSI